MTSGGMTHRLGVSRLQHKILRFYILTYSIKQRQLLLDIIEGSSSRLLSDVTTQILVTMQCHGRVA